MQIRTALAALLGVAGIAAAQTPSINSGGIVNVASYAYAGTPGGDIAQGSMVTVFGSNMGPSTLVQATSFPLQNTLGGTSLKVQSGGTTTLPLINFTSAGQIAAIIPSATPVGPATMTVTYNGQTSAPVSFNVVANSFGTFTTNASGGGPGIVANAQSQVFGATTAANPDDAAVIWGTGLGAVTGTEANGPLPGDMATLPVEVYVGTSKALVTYRGRSGCCAGIDQITFTVPSVFGCHVSVVLKINNTVSNSTTMPIAPKGGRTCSDPGGPSATDLQKYSTNGASIGAISLLRLSSSISVAGFNLSTNIDTGAATFTRYSPLQLSLNGNPFATATLGSCSVTFAKAGVATPVPAIGFTSLDAGPAITVVGAGGTKQMAKTGLAGVSSYAANFGTNSSGAGYLDSGTFTISGAGGADVGAFSTSLVIPPVLSWTNMATVNTVTRGSGQLITWTGGDPAGTVLIAGFSSNSTASDAVTGTFVCQAKASDGSFQIPGAVLLGLPVTASTAGAPLGALFVGISAAPKTFTASGLDIGVAVSTVDALKTISYQ